MHQPPIEVRLPGPGRSEERNYRYRMNKVIKKLEALAPAYFV
jgi:hypothetical protein